MLGGDWILDLDENVVRFDQGDSTLIVTFDFMDARPAGGDPAFWAHTFIRRNGWSFLGVASKGNTWFRSRELHQALLSLKETGFFQRFDRVMFAGASMGGFGATAFSSLRPGSTVVALNPQSTLARSLVPFEHRFPMGRSQDWSWRVFRDGAEEIASAADVWVAYDPYERLDRLHAERFQGPNVRHLKSFHLGHGIGGAYLEMGLLKEIMSAFVQGLMSEAGYYEILRKRRLVRAYHRNLFTTAMRRGRIDLARIVYERQAPVDDWFLKRRRLVGV